MSSRIWLTLSRSPRQAGYPSRAPPPPIHPQPTLSTSPRAHPRSLPHAPFRSIPFTHSSSASLHYPTGAVPLPLSPVRPPSLPLNTCTRRCDRTVGTTASAPLDARVPPKRLLHARNTLTALCHRPSQPVDAQGATTSHADHRGHRARIKGPVPLSLSLFPSVAPPPHPQHLSEHPPKLPALPRRGELAFA
jgi:hypothetical protein